MKRVISGMVNTIKPIGHERASLTSIVEEDLMEAGLFCEYMLKSYVRNLLLPFAVVPLVRKENKRTGGEPLGAGPAIGLGIGLALVTSGVGIIYACDNGRWKYVLPGLAVSNVVSYLVNAKKRAKEINSKI